MNLYRSQSVAQRSRARQLGFTAIELIVVLVAIGILAVLALRAFGVVHKTKGTVEAQNILDTVNSVLFDWDRITTIDKLEGQVNKFWVSRLRRKSKFKRMRNIRVTTIQILPV